MADVMFTKGLGIAKDKLTEVVKFNEGKSRSQYKYVYIVELFDGYMVRFSQKKPTSKKILNLTEIRVKPNKKITLKQLAKKATDAWTEERNFGEQETFMGVASEDLKVSKDDYIGAIEEYNHWSLAEWVDDNW